MNDIKSDPGAMTILRKPAILFWNIWKARNSKTFEDKDIRPQDIVQSTLKLLEEL